MINSKTVVEAKTRTTPIIKEFEPMKETKLTVNLPVIFTIVFIVVLGGISGYLLANGKSGGKTGNVISGDKTSTGLAKIVGVQDEKTFKDSAEGILREGGIDSEGSHHLERPGGDSQNVYLTSSSVALDNYIGKKVKVWGQTFSSEKAGWLMDVGRLELLE